MQTYEEKYRPDPLPFVEGEVYAQDFKLAFQTIPNPFDGDPRFYALANQGVFAPSFLDVIPSKEIKARAGKPFPVDRFELCVGWHPMWRYLPRMEGEPHEISDFLETLDWKEQYEKALEDPELQILENKKSPEKMVCLVNFDALVKQYGEIHTQTVVDHCYDQVSSIVWNAVRHRLSVSEIKDYLNQHYIFTERTPRLVDLWELLKSVAIYDHGLSEDLVKYDFVRVIPRFPLPFSFQRGGELYKIQYDGLIPEIEDCDRLNGKIQLAWGKEKRLEKSGKSGVTLTLF